MNNNDQTDPLAQGSLYFKGATSLKLLVFGILIICFIISIVQDFKVITFLMLVVAFLNIFYNIIGLLCSIYPRLLNLHDFKKASKIIWIIHVFSLIIPFMAFRQLNEVVYRAIEYQAKQQNSPQSQEQLQIAAQIGSFFVIFMVDLFYFTFCILDYGNQLITNFWIYITLQRNANHHPPPHIDGDQANLLHITAPLGPGMCFLKIITMLGMIGTIFPILIALLSFDLKQIISLPLFCFYFYHYRIGWKTASSPTLLNLYQFQKSSKRLGYVKTILFIFSGLGFGLILSQTKESQEKMNGFLLLIAILVYWTCLFVINASDYINYIIASYWIYIILQHNANQHPPPHMFDYESQFGMGNNSLPYSNSNTSSQVVNNQQSRDWIQLSNENA